MKRRGSRVQIRLSFWNRTQPLLLKENARGGAMRHLLFLNENPKDVAVRNPVLVKEYKSTNSPLFLMEKIAATRHPLFLTEIQRACSFV